MASHYKALENRLKNRVTWEEAGDVPDKVLKEASSFQAPNGGMAYFKPEDNRVSPYLSAYTALAFNWLKERGYQPPQLLKVHLQEYLLTLPAAGNFVVVDDPLPGGLEAVNRDLATASMVDAGKTGIMPQSDSNSQRDNAWPPKDSRWNDRTFRDRYSVSQWYFYHRDMGHDGVRYYADRLPPGRYVLSYTAQAIARGSFTALPAQVLEMYDPDVFGKSVEKTLIVEQ